MTRYQEKGLSFSSYSTFDATIIRRLFQTATEVLHLQQANKKHKEINSNNKEITLPSKSPEPSPIIPTFLASIPLTNNLLEFSFEINNICASSSKIKSG